MYSRGVCVIFISADVIWFPGWINAPQNKGSAPPVTPGVFKYRGTLSVLWSPNGPPGHNVSPPTLCFLPRFSFPQMGGLHHLGAPVNIPYWRRYNGKRCFKCGTCDFINLLETVFVAPILPPFGKLYGKALYARAKLLAKGSSLKWFLSALLPLAKEFKTGGFKSH